MYILCTRKLQISIHLLLEQLLQECVDVFTSLYPIVVLEHLVSVPECFAHLKNSPSLECPHEYRICFCVHTE